MSDTIDRQAAIEIVDRYDKAHMILKGKPMLGAASIVIELEALPPAQPEPHEGHWIGSDGSYICSECNGDPLDFIDTMGASCDAYVETLMNFCPNCGAKMRGEQHETD